MLNGINIYSFAALSENNSISPDSLKDNPEESQLFYPYFTQTMYLKWQKEFEIIDMQGLLVPELGFVYKDNSDSDISVYLDFSVDAQIFDLYNIHFSPVNINLNQACLSYKTDFSNKYLPDNLKCELYSDYDIFDNEIVNLGLEARWFPEKNLELYTELLFYDLFSSDNLKQLENKYGLMIGTQWSDILNSKDNRHTDLIIEYSGIEKQILFQIDQQINDESYLEIAYTNKHKISASLTYDINNNCQLELTGIFENINTDYQPEQSIREFSIITSFTWYF